MSSVKHFMPLYVGDYLADTAHLTAAEHGAYLLLIMHYWRTGGLPNEDAQLARIARCTKREWEKTRPVIAAFFDENWKHDRVASEIEKAEAAYERRAKAGHRGGKAKAEAKQSSSNAIAMNKQPESEPELERKIIDDDSARGKLDRLESSLREAAGEALNPTALNLSVLERPLAWLTAGCDLDADIIPAIRAASARASPQSIKSWKYFEQPVADAKATRLAPMAEGRPQAKPFVQKIYGSKHGDDSGSQINSNRTDAAVLDAAEGCGRDELGISDRRIADVVRDATRR